MRTIRALLTGVLTAGLLVAAAQPAPALTGFAGGSFENPVVTPNTFQLFTAGQTMGAWTVTQGDVHLIGAGFWQAADGVQSLDLDGSVAGGVSQTLSTLPLLKYKVRFKLAGNPAAGPTIKTGVLLANGSAVLSYSFDITGKSFANMGYVSQEAHFLATTLTTTLEFRSTTGSGFGPVIDKVTVESCLLVICLG